MESEFCLCHGNYQIQGFFIYLKETLDSLKKYFQISIMCKTPCLVLWTYNVISTNLKPNRNSKLYRHSYSNNYCVHGTHYAPNSITGYL